MFVRLHYFYLAIPFSFFRRTCNSHGVSQKVVSQARRRLTLAVNKYSVSAPNERFVRLLTVSERRFEMFRHWFSASYGNGRCPPQRMNVI